MKYGDLEIFYLRTSCCWSNAVCSKLLLHWKTCTRTLNALCAFCILILLLLVNKRLQHVNQFNFLIYQFTEHFKCIPFSSTLLIIYSLLLFPHSYTSSLSAMYLTISAGLNNFSASPSGISKPTIIQKKLN